MDDAVIPLMPIWDTIIELERLRGIADMMAMLLSPCCLKEDHEYGIFYDFVIDFTDRLSAACTALRAAREKATFIKEEKPA